MEKESNVSINGEAANDANYEKLEENKDLAESSSELKGVTSLASKDDKCYADLYAIARIILASHGIENISGGNNCTYRDQDLFFSYRRDGVRSGRMATLAVIRDN